MSCFALRCLHDRPTSPALNIGDFFMSKIKAVRLSEIRIDGGTQQRCEINNAIVEEYAEAMRCGAKFPPVALFFDGAVYWLADGFHRYHANKAAGMLDILGEIHEGINRDAIFYSTGANGTHGIRLTNDDKRKAVGILLADKEWSQWSDRDIAKHCKVTHPFVAKLRNPEKLVSTNKVVTVTTPPLQPAPVLDPQNEKTAEIAQNPENHEPEYTELDAAHDQITDLQGMLAAGGLDREDAEEYVKSLLSEIKTLKASLDAVTISRDTLMNENASLKRQCLAQARKIKKYESGGNVK